jgi:hypothetical protein
MRGSTVFSLQTGVCQRRHVVRELTVTDLRVSFCSNARPQRQHDDHSNDPHGLMAVAALWFDEVSSILAGTAESRACFRLRSVTQPLAA